MKRCRLSCCDCLQVLKVAILAEKYAVDYTWYVDTILNLIRLAGDYVSEEVSIILNCPELSIHVHRIPLRIIPQIYVNWILLLESMEAKSKK